MKNKKKIERLDLSEGEQVNLQEFGMSFLIVSAIFLVVPALVTENKVVSAVLLSLFAALNVPILIRFTAMYYLGRGIKIRILGFISLISFIAAFVLYCNHEGILFFI
jgi:hypothetical protein